MNRFIPGLLIGMFVIFAFYHAVIIPRFQSVIDEGEAHASEFAKTTEKATATLKLCVDEQKKLYDTAQEIIDITNECVKMLWTLPLDDIETIRTKEMPQLSPVSPTTYTPSGTIDSTDSVFL